MVGSIREADRSGEVAGMALAAGLATLAAVTQLGSRTPLLLFLAPIGGAGLVYVALRPKAAATLMVVVEVTNVSGVLSTRGNIPFFQASMLVGLLAVGLALRNPDLRVRLNAWTAWSAALCAFYILTQVVAAIGTTDPVASLGSLRRTSLDCLFLLIVMCLIQLAGQQWVVAAAFVLPLAGLSLLTAIDEFVFNGTQSFAGFSTLTKASGEMVTTRRYGGPLPDSNFWGRHLVMGLPLAAALLVRALRSGRRATIVIWAAVLLTVLAGVYLTQSRGTFVAASVGVAVWFLAVEGSVRRWGRRGLPMGVLVLAVPGIGNRLQSAVHDLSHASPGGQIDPSLLARLNAQQAAQMMFRERPIFGFGPGTFPGESVNFTGRVAVAVREAAGAPHNLYLEFLAESGWFGLFGWTVLIAGFLSAAVLRIICDPQSRDRVLAAAAGAGIVAWLVASAALHLSYFRTLAIVLALCASLAPAWPVPAKAIRSMVQGIVVWSTALVLGLAVFSGCRVISSRPAVQATQQMTLVPAGPIDGYYAYALDIRSRIEFLPTFATLFETRNSPVSVKADPVRGTLTFDVTADTVNQARDRIQLAVGDASAQLHGSIGYQYSLQTLGSMKIGRTHVRSQLSTLVAAGLGLVASLVGGTLVSAILRSRRSRRSSVGTQGADVLLRVPQ